MGVGTAIPPPPLLPPISSHLPLADISAPRKADVPAQCKQGKEGVCPPPAASPSPMQTWAARTAGCPGCAGAHQRQEAVGSPSSASPPCLPSPAPALPAVGTATHLVGRWEQRRASRPGWDKLRTRMMRGPARRRQSAHPKSPNPPFRLPRKKTCFPRAALPPGPAPAPPAAGGDLSSVSWLSMRGGNGGPEGTWWGLPAPSQGDGGLWGATAGGRGDGWGQSATAGIF